MKVGLLSVTLLVILASVAVLNSKSDTSTPITPQQQTIQSSASYLAIGDSYTIGEGVTATERWPNQLVTQLKASGVDIELAGNPSVTGYTTQDVIEFELPLVGSLDPKYVSVLVGVNDYVQGVPIETFGARFKQILDRITETVSPDNVLVVTIPDYSKTPTGQRFGDPAVASKAINQMNSIITAEATQRQIPVVDIYPISQLAATDQSLTAADGLHPSGKQYSEWVDQILLVHPNLFSRP